MVRWIQYCFTRTTRYRCRALSIWRLASRTLTRRHVPIDCQPSCTRCAPVGGHTLQQIITRKVRVWGGGTVRAPKHHRWRAFNTVCPSQRANMVRHGAITQMSRRGRCGSETHCILNLAGSPFACLWTSLFSRATASDTVEKSLGLENARVHRPYTPSGGNHAPSIYAATQLLWRYTPA